MPLLGFPYSVVYRRDAESLLILAVAHQSRRPGWTLPTFGQLVGPNELADVVIAFRRFSFEGISRGELPPPGDDRLRALIRIAFNTSLVAEEGSYPRTRLFVHRGDSWQPKPGIVAELDEPIPDNVDGVLRLKRLAPIADSFDSVLVLEEKREGWRCVGVATISQPIYAPEIGRSLLNPDRDPPAGVSIRIDGPGLLRVTDTGSTFVLHGGRIRQTTELFHAPPIRELLCRIDLALTQDKDIPRFPGTGGRTHQRALPIEFALSRIVARTREARKGGALIFPGETETSLIDTGNFNIRGTSLGDALHSFHTARQASTAAKKSDDELRDVVADWQNAQQTILRLTEFVASLSKVDGCVVLKPNLDVVAFGAKIRVAQCDEVKPALTLVNPFTKKHESDEEIMRLGTRHRSAYSLCRCLPGTTAIVVSQDGDIRVFSSDSDHSYFVDSLDASSIGLPLF